jgi:hypothetical protein
LTPRPQAALLRAQVLSAWQKYTGVPQKAMAATLGVTPQLVSGLLKGTEGKLAVFNHPLDPPTPADDPDRYERTTSPESLATSLALSADEATCFVAMHRSAGSPAGTAPQEVTYFNFRKPGCPGWIWVRVPGQQAAEIRLTCGGALIGTAVVGSAEPGLIVALPTTISNPALRVITSTQTWVNAGHGVMPPAVARNLATRVDDVRPMPKLPVERRHLDLLAGSVFTVDPSTRRQVSVLHRLHQVARALDMDRDTAVSLATMLLSPPIRSSVQVAGARTDRRPKALSRQPEGGSLDRLLMSGAELKALRQDARGTTRKHLAAKLVNLEPDHPVTDRDIETLEHDDRLPAIPHLISRIDAALAGSGLVGCEQSFDSRRQRPAPDGPHEVSFPEYWIGPVWIRLDGPAHKGECSVDLVWDRWALRQTWQNGMTASTRRAPGIESPLMVRTQPGWRVRAGTGLPPEAVDVQGSWVPVSDADAIDELRKILDAIGPYIRRTAQ